MENPITDLRSEHVPALKKFIERQFHSNYILLNDTFFDWQYKKKPYNAYPEYAMKIILHKDEIGGYLGLIPVSFSGETKRGVCFANLMVDERLRAFGWGMRLIQEAMRDMPFAYINGYNPATETIYEKSGWLVGKMGGNLQRWVGVLNKEKVKDLAEGAELREMPSLSSDIFLELVTSFDGSFDKFWGKIKKNFPITHER